MLDSLLIHQTREDFLKAHFLRLPFAQPGGCRGVVSEDAWTLIDRLLQSEAPDVMVVKEGRRWTEFRVPAPAEARELFREGYTLLCRHAERHDETLARIAQSFADDLAAPVDVHLYFTPGDAFGFGWHYDVEDVFILQLEGGKEYSLRKNTVNPWPVLDNMPQDLRYEREIMPMMKCELAAGDWLYIPHGYWHKGEGKSDSLSLAVGVMSRTALDILDFARQRLIDSIRWRQRLPLDDETALDTLCKELGEDLAAIFQDPNFAKRFQESRAET